MKRFVFSDSHGGYQAMVQCLERCGFDKEQGQLYFIGDVVDGWSESKESIELFFGFFNRLIKCTSSAWVDGATSLIK